MSHIFISYSKKNSEYAYRLADQLRELGFDVWIDNRRLGTSQNWWRSIVEAIWSSSAFIVILSKESVTSRWVQREIMIADEQGKPLFPIALDKGSLSTPFGQMFLTIQYYDAFQGNMPDDEFIENLTINVPRKDKPGQNLNKTSNHPLIETHDDDFVKAVQNPPNMDNIIFDKDNRKYLISGVVATLTLAFAVIFGVLMSNSADSETPPDATDTLEVTATVETDILEEVANLENYNIWRTRNGYAALVENDLLDAIADAQRSYLSSQAVDNLPAINPVLSQDGLSAQTMASQEGYEGEVQMFVEVTQSAFTMDELILRLEANGIQINDQGIHEWPVEAGISQFDSPDTEYTYFVLILGTGA